MDEKYVAYLDKILAGLDKILAGLDEVQGKLDYHSYALRKVLEKEREMSAELDALAEAVAGISATGKAAVAKMLELEKKVDDIIKAGTDPATTAKLVELKNIISDANAEIAKGIVDASDGIVVPPEPPAPPAEPVV